MLRIAVTCILAVSACIAAEPHTDDEAKDLQPSSGTHWNAVLHCGGDGVVVDVDQDERRHLQAVVRDDGAVAWLSTHPGAGPAGIPNQHGEIIVRGIATKGVFSPVDFTSVSQRGYSVADALLPEAYASREGSGLRVRLVTWASGHEVETSNWYFADCD